MESITPELHRVLSLSPHSKGFGFAVFEQQHRPLDWGVKRVRGQQPQLALRKVEALIGIYQPEALLLEPPERPRRSPRIQALAVAIVEHAQLRGIAVVAVNRNAVRVQFEPLGATTKHAIAAAIVQLIPALAPCLPAPRKPWQSEDARMAIFDAVALALCWYAEIQ